MDEIYEPNEIKPLFQLLPTTPVKTKHKHEFQELGQMLEPIYGKGIWAMFYKVGFTEYKIRKAHEICFKKGITKLGYLIGVVKKLK